MSAMTVKELLISGKGIISEESKWTKGYYAHNKSGAMVESSASDAVCFCSLGALYRVAPDLSSGEVSEAELLLNRLSPKHDIVDYNDDLNTTHEQILALWDKAIKVAEEEEMKV